jgi:hypothetical protein
MYSFTIREFLMNHLMMIGRTLIRTSSGYHKIPRATHFRTVEPSESIETFIGTRFPDPAWRIVTDTVIRETEVKEILQ